MDAESNFQSYLKSDRRYNRWKNATADRLVTQEEQSIVPRQRQQALYGLQQLLKANAPYIYLYQVGNIYGMSARAHWTPNPIGLLQMYSATVS